MSSFKKGLLFYNENAGQSNSTRQLAIIKDHFSKCQIDLEIIRIPLPTDEIGAILSKVSSKGIDLIVAAGGDGTVSLVGSSIIRTDIPLGILPIGTGNLLARELKIPMDLESALETITSGASSRNLIDAIQLNNQTYVLNISTGVSAKMMERTNVYEKRRMGVFAYILHFFQQLLGLQLEKFEIECDGIRKNYSASEVLVTNVQVAGLEPLKWPEPVSLSDGALDLFIIRAANLLDVMAFVFVMFTKRRSLNPVYKYVRIKSSCRIEPKGQLNVQADGDIVAQTPITVNVLPHALTIITPNPETVQLNYQNFLRKGMK